MECGVLKTRAPLNTAADFFSPDYATARARFRTAAEAAGAALHVLGLDAKGPAGENLTIDIAWLGAPTARRVLLHTSGLHGVEAFAGSAIQLALLDKPPRMEADCALILAHVLNPYGMAWLRRANENNVDLNRNFLGDGESWSGAPAVYRHVDHILNPRTPPASDFFYMQALWQTLRRGFRPLKRAVARGQYAFPRGLSEWADFDYVAGRGPWITPAQWRQVERFKFYTRHAWKPGAWRWPLRATAQWRCNHDWYGLPVEKMIVDLVRRPQQVS